MLFKYKILFFILLLLFLGCAEKSDYVLLQTDNNTSKYVKSVVASTEYIIMPQDRLKISIYRNPETSRYVSSDIGQDFDSNGILVDAKGYIYLPLIEKVKVAGLSQGEASALLTRRFKKYLKIPLISLEVLNKRIYVIGEVNKPGPVTLDREKMTLLEAIAYAGDLTDAAIRDNIIILSKSNTQKPYLRRIDLTNFDNLHLSNMMLLPNDIVYVQPNGWKEFKVSSDNFTAPFKTITEIASPFVQMHYLFE
jgi:polysaccharide export outer membrane protein